MRMDREPVLFTRKRRHWGRWLISLVLAAVALCALYTFYDNGRVVIRTQRVLVSNLPEELEGFTVLLLSDLNGKRFGPEQEHLINLLQNQRYDVVCVSGDMVGSGADPYPFYELLHSLSTQPVYFIAGDSDPVAVGGQPEGYYTVLADWIAGAQTRGAVYLDAPASLQVGEATVWFSDAAQIDLDLDSAAAAYAAAGTGVASYWLDVIARTQAAREQMREEDLHLALSHPPLRRESLQALLDTAGEEAQAQIRSVDLVLSGGTAGGQWILPGLGPVWANGHWLPEEEVTGLSYIANMPQYITGGLGVNAASPLPAFRLFNTPEAALITFSSHTGA